MALEELHDNELFIAHGVPKNEKDDKEQYIVLREAVTTTRGFSIAILSRSFKVGLHKRS